MSTLRLYDAHNHAHDCLARSSDDVWGPVRRENIHRMVVNGSSEEDWEAVLSLAQEHAEVIPSFGYHPWYVR